MLIHEKSSLAPPGQSLAFSLGDEKGFEWIGAYDITADELLTGTDTAKTESKTAQAEMLILELLADGKRMPSAELEKTQTEQTELKAKVSEGRKRLSDEVQLANDAKQWVEAIQEYANITELDAATLNRLIKEIVVHERIDEDKTRHISIEIHFNLKPIPEVGQVTA